MPVPKQSLLTPSSPSVEKGLSSSPLLKSRRLSLPPSKLCVKPRSPPEDEKDSSWVRPLRMIVSPYKQKDDNQFAIEVRNDAVRVLNLVEKTSTSDAEKKQPEEEIQYKENLESKLPTGDPALQIEQDMKQQEGADMLKALYHEVKIALSQKMRVTITRDSLEQELKYRQKYLHVTLANESIQRKLVKLEIACLKRELNKVQCCAEKVPIKLFDASEHSVALKTTHKFYLKKLKESTKKLEEVEQKHREMLELHKTTIPNASSLELQISRAMDKEKELQNVVIRKQEQVEKLQHNGYKQDAYLTKQYVAAKLQNLKKSKAWLTALLENSISLSLELSSVLSESGDHHDDDEIFCRNVVDHVTALQAPQTHCAGISSSVDQPRKPRALNIPRSPLLRAKSIRSESPDDRRSRFSRSPSSFRSSRRARSRPIRRSQSQQRVDSTENTKNTKSIKNYDWQMELEKDFKRLSLEIEATRRKLRQIEEKV